MSTDKRVVPGPGSQWCPICDLYFRIGSHSHEEPMVGIFKSTPPGPGEATGAITRESVEKLGTIGPDPVFGDLTHLEEQLRAVREFASGATRDNNEDKLCYHGFLSPVALERFATYMHTHRKQADGKLRDSDNWKKGIPVEAYHESLIRHIFDYWKLWESNGIINHETAIDDLLCAILFNVQGLLHERNSK